MKQPLWWNADCQELKRIKYVHLNILRLTNTNQDIELYSKACEEFKYCKARKTQYHTEKLDSLFGISQSTDLWKKINTNAKSKGKVGNIQPKEWFDKFSDLLRKNDNVLNEEFENYVND